MNTIFILLDTLRRDHLGCYGNSWIKTPHLDAFAAKSTVFENAYLASSPCMPARRDIMTGRYEFPFRGWGPLEPGDRDLAGALSDAGKHTYLVTDHYHLFEHGSGNYHFHYNGWQFIRGHENDAWVSDPGIEPRWPAPERTKCHFRWAQYYRNTAQWRNADGVWADERQTFTAQTFRAATQWLERNRTQPGFFLTIDHFDPHEPFDPPAPYDTLYADGKPPAERVRWPIYGKADRYTEAELLDIRALYAGKVSLVDTWFGFFMNRLEELGLLENTTVVVTTDHGHLFGEHGMIGKPGSGHGDSTLYQPMAHIPLLVYHPDFKRQGGQRRTQLVQPVDYYPTILETMGVAQKEQRLHGRSLLPCLRSNAEPLREYAYFGKFGEAVHVTDGAWSLAKWPPDRERNAPLHWYSALPPEFIKPRGVGAFDRAKLRYPVDHVRGPMSDALWFLPEDYAQERNVLAERPHEAARLEGALARWLRAIDAPPEQAERLGLRETVA
ncbi:MAG: arylsulfatase [Planctomycetota bacterium]